jgi:hypothetical protein
MLLSLLSITVLTAPVGPAAATVDAGTPWGANGHRIVAAIAERHLLPVTRMRITELVGPYPLARFGEWADKYRASPEGRHTYSWHFVSVEDGEQYERQAYDEPGDVLQALEHQERILADTSRSDEDRAMALKFLVHFLGDMHQPLHVGRAGDRGGNDIDVRWFGTSTNLHSVWDSRMLEFLGLSYSEYTAFLDFASAEQIAAWTAGDYVSWSADAMAARPTVYALPDAEPGTTPRLGWDYLDAATPIIEAQLLKAGLRLAAVLNRTLGGTQGGV